MKRDFAAGEQQNHRHRAADYLPTSEDAPVPKRSNNGSDGNGDGDTVEAIRRPRGRPPGSKNRPKPPAVVPGDSTSEQKMTPYVLELPAGVDVVESTARFCRRKGTGLCVINGNGVVANVTLKQPSTGPGGTVTFRGQFDILSISATVLPGGGGYGYPPVTFSVTLAGPQGRMVGGSVFGPLISAGTVYLIAAAFNPQSSERLSTDDAAAVDARNGGREPSQAVSDRAPIYNYQASEVVWAPPARRLQPSPVAPY